MISLIPGLLQFNEQPEINYIPKLEGKSKAKATYLHIHVGLAIGTADESPTGHC